MNRHFYPAIFHKAEEGGYWVTFPDIPECMTQGETLDEAYEMSLDALGIVLVDKELNNEIPAASSPNSFSLSDDEFCVIVEFDMFAYKKRTASYAVKTLSIPAWMNEEATKRGINFSQVLQEALANKFQYN